MALPPRSLTSNIPDSLKSSAFALPILALVLCGLIALARLTAMSFPDAPSPPQPGASEPTASQPAI